jgi:glycosyltransferase involved in cell wall biosynthesis
MDFRIALVTDTFARGGVQKVIALLANALAECGVQVGVYCLDGIGDAEDWLFDNVELFSVGRRAGRALDLRCVSRLRTMWYEQKVDIVQSHNWSTLLECAASVFRNSGIKHIYTEHGGLIVKPGNSVVKNLGRKCIARVVLNCANSRVAIANRLRVQLSEETGVSLNAIECIPNGIQIPKLSFRSQQEARGAMRYALSLQQESFLFGTVARLHEIKRIDSMIDAFSRIAGQFRDVFFVIVGEGQEKKRLVDRARNHNLEQKVFFVGEQSNVGDWLSCMDVYVNSSRSEGMSIAILEAMAYGIPTIATDVGDSGLLVGGDHPAGLVVPPDGTNSLATAMENMYTSAENRREFSENGRSRFRESYTLSIMLENYMALYQRLLAER